jgi:hypothetical protein
MSGGKGGSSTSAQQIPDWMRQPAERNIARAEQAQQIGYQPYYGLDVAAMNPTQMAAGQANINAAQAFGMAPPSLTAYQGMAQPEMVGGVSGYSSAPMYEQAVAAGGMADPTQQQIYNTLFGTDKGYS